MNFRITHALMTLSVCFTSQLACGQDLMPVRQTVETPVMQEVVTEEVLSYDEEMALRRAAYRARLEARKQATYANRLEYFNPANVEYRRVRKQVSRANATVQVKVNPLGTYTVLPPVFVPHHGHVHHHDYGHGHGHHRDHDVHHQQAAASTSK